jgi:hypothetical protein
MFFQGGLGNQLFQWSFAKYVEAQTGKAIKFSDILLKIPLPKVTKRDLEIKGLLEESDLINDIESISRLAFLKLNRDKKNLIDDNNFLNIDSFSGFSNYLGFFQSHVFIDEIWNSIAPNIKKLEMFKVLGARETPHYISAHLRLGDYLLNSKTSKHHGVVSINYIVKGLNNLRDQTSINNVKIVTDSVEFVSEYVHALNKNDFSVDVISSDSKHDFHTLVNSSGIVISNSSYSWWAGYYSNKLFETKIIAPFPWFRNIDIEPKFLIPPSWLRIER